ncbi:MAG TPA: energy transducer TonB [Steroidobacteraceae bacterium]|nr:energy transducer TonB [Steroidobacteraceae bacterium]
MALTAQAQEQQGTKRTVIMILVILLHVACLWALQNGLARRLVEILPNDIKAKIVEEQKKEEPPPPPPPPPDQAAPPPPFVPPVEVAVASAIEVPVNAITTTSEKPPVTPPPVMAPKQQVIIGPRVDMKKSLGSCDELYNESSALKRDNAAGSVVVRCTIASNGRCNDPSVAKASGNDAIDTLGTRCAKELLRFVPGTVDGAVQTQVYEFKLTFKPKER